MSNQRKDATSQFANTAATYRRRKKRLAVVGIILLIFFFLALLSFPRAWWVAAGFLVVFFILAIWGWRTVPGLICPACSLDAETDFVRFCPECGSDDVQTKAEDKHFLVWPRCRACGREFTRSAKGNRRLWLIRFCTRCGALLDEAGL